MTLDFEKEQAVQALCAHYAQDHLSTGELETRFERVYKSTSRSQLDTVLEGLPALQRAQVAPAPLFGPKESAHAPQSPPALRNRRLQRSRGQAPWSWGRW